MNTDFFVWHLKHCLGKLWSIIICFRINCNFQEGSTFHFWDLTMSISKQIFWDFVKILPAHYIPRNSLTGFVMFFWFHGSTLQEILNFEKDEVLSRICFEHLGRKVNKLSWNIELCTYTRKALPDMVASNSKELALIILEVLSTSCVLLSCVQSPFKFCCTMKY